MKPEEAIEMLRGMQNKKVDYAEMVCAPAFAYGYEYVYPYPEDYAIEEAIEALKEVQQYRKIGTVEECREAVKKQKLKTPGRTGMDEQDCYICPNCGADIGSIDDYFPRDRYCHEFGQAIQWNENLEEMEDERD